MGSTRGADSAVPGGGGRTEADESGEVSVCFCMCWVG